MRSELNSIYFELNLKVKPILDEQENIARSILGVNAICGEISAINSGRQLKIDMPGALKAWIMGL
jgi:hypothetical protein